MKYRLIDTPEFKVKHVREWNGCGSVIWIHRNGTVQHSRDKDWLLNQDAYNPTGLVARAFEVVQDEWTWEVFRSPIPGIEYYAVRLNGGYACQFTTPEAAAEYCAWKNGGGV